jgi:pyruvate formate lyase activating enzyme
MLKIHSIETFGTHEGPGIRLVIFVQGCNFHCAYCHNPDTISAIGGYEVSNKEIISQLEEQRPYFINGGGLTVSGGEPLLWSKELISLFREVKKRGFNIALDTNGSIDTSDAKKVFDLSDLVMIDLKHFNNNVHRELTGQSNEKVLKMIEYRESTKKPFWVRHVLVPGWSERGDSLKEMSEYLKKFKHLKRLEILPYHNLGEYKYKELGEKYRLKGQKPPSRKELEETMEIFAKLSVPVIVRH